MKNKPLFPKEFIKASLENYTCEIRKVGLSIFQALLIVVVLGIISLPLISVDISESLQGNIDTDLDHFILSAPVSGQVMVNEIAESKLVKSGDTLLLINTDHLSQEREKRNVQKHRLELYLKDINALIKNKGELATQQYQLAFIEFQTNKNRLKLTLDNQIKLFNREKLLHEQGVIADQDLEEAEIVYNNARFDLALFQKQQMTKRKKEALQFEREIEQLAITLANLEVKISNSIVKSPYEGELQYVSPVSKGQFLVAGTKLAELAPIGKTIAVCWVPTRDIGLVKVGMTGHFRIEAFNYNDWGMLSGKVQKISREAYIIDQQPFFKVTCELEDDRLQLKGGQVGYLMNGMTLQASFIVANRSLYQLLYDKVDNWINPEINQTAFNQ